MPSRHAETQLRAIVTLWRQHIHAGQAAALHVYLHCTPPANLNGFTHVIPGTEPNARAQAQRDLKPDERPYSNHPRHEPKSVFNPNVRPSP